MFIKPSKQRCQGLSLVEMMIAVGVFSVVSIAVMTLFLFSIRSFGQLVNYAELDAENRRAVDLLTREIRQAQHVVGFSNGVSASWLTLRNGDDVDVTYAFDLNKQTMTRSTGGSPEVLLTNCTILNFSCYQRNPTLTGFEIYDIGKNNPKKYIKAVELTWRTRKHLNPTTLINSENVQTARIIIRKQQEED